MPPTSASRRRLLAVLISAALLWVPMAPLGHAAPGAPVANPEVTGQEWTTPSVVRVGQTPARSVMIPFDTVGDAKANPDLHSAERASTNTKLLNGTWKFNYVPRPADKPQLAGVTEVPATGFRDIVVPSSWQVAGKYAGALGTDFPIYNNQDYPFQAAGGGIDSQGDFEAAQAPTTFNPVGTYMRTVDLSADEIAGNRQILSFLGVEAGFYLYVNGAVVGYGEDSFSTSEFDITDYVHEGTNHIAVQVYRWTTGSFLENQDGLDFGGIHRDVVLTVQPKASIYDYNVETTFANHDYSSVKVEVRSDIANTSDVAEARIVKTHLFDASGNEVAVKASSELTVAPGTTGSVTTEIVVANPALWSAEVPNLYTVVLELTDAAGTSIQSMGKRVGIREFYMAGAGTTDSTSNMRINGQNIEFYGVNRGENDPAYGHHVPYEMIVKDVQNAKQLNMNAIRTSHFPPDPHLLDLADVYGIYVMDEVNVESHNGRDGINNTPFSIDPSLTSRDFPGNDSRYTESMRQRMESMVQRDKSHASVLIYSLGNEAGTGPNFETMMDVIKELDGEKLIHYQGDNGNPRVDMIGAMYPPYDQANRPDSRKPFIMMEYQHSMGNTGGELKRYTDIMEGSHRQQGGFIWDYVDQSALTLKPGVDPGGDVTRDDLFYGMDGSWPQVSGDGNFLMNGLIFPDRTWQPEAYEVRQQYQDIKFTQTPMQGTAQQVTMVNLNRFKNANHYDVVWSLQEDGATIQSGTFTDAEANLAAPTGNVNAGSTKTLTAPYVLDAPKAGAEYFLLVEYKLKAKAPYAEKGYVQGSAQFLLGAVGQDQNIDPTAVPPSTTQNLPDAVVVEGETPSGEKFSVSVDKTTGLLDSYVVGGRDLISKAPVGSFFRAETDQSSAVKGNAHTKNVGEAYQGWLDQGENATDVKVNVLTAIDGVSRIVVNSTLRNGSAFSTVYTVHTDGTIAVAAKLVPSAGAPDQLGEFGMMMQVPSALENLSWYGRGPAETYWDRKEGVKVGVWNGTVTDQFVPYERVQENGNKTDVRWLALTDDAGDGLLASMNYGPGYSGDPLEAVALHYTPKALSSYNSKILYPFEAQKTDDVVLRLLKHQKGVGNLDWGSEPPTAVLPKNDTANQSYSYMLRPLTAGTDPMTLSKEIYPEPAFPMLDAITIDGMPLTGFQPETFAYDYTLPDYYPSTRVPVVAATAPEGTTVTIEQPGAAPGTAILHVKVGSSTVDYVVVIHPAEAPKPTIQIPDIVQVPGSVSASGRYTVGMPGVGDLLYAYSGYGVIGENTSTAGAALQTASGFHEKGFQGNAEQIMDVDISAYAAKSFSGVGGIDPSKWSGSGATRSSIIFEVWAHRDVSELDAAYYEPMAPGAAGTGTIVTNGWTKLSFSPVQTGKKDFTFSDIALIYDDDGVPKRYEALRLVMNANGDNGHDQGVWGDPRIGLDVPADPELRSIQLDGAPLPGFSPDVHDYTVVLASGARTPVVSADHDSGIFVHANQAAGVPGTATVLVGAGDYRIQFTRATAPSGQLVNLSDMVTAPAFTVESQDQSAVLNGNLVYAYSGEGAVRVDEGAGTAAGLTLRESGRGDAAVIREYAHGFAGSAQQVLDIDISHRDGLRFTADVGVDWGLEPDSTETTAGPTVRFEVWARQDAGTLTNGYYSVANPEPTGGGLPTDGWVKLGTSPVMSNWNHSGALEVQRDLHHFDLDLTHVDADGALVSYGAVRLVMDPVDGDIADDHGVWGDPQVTFLGDVNNEPVDVTRLTATVEPGKVSVGYLLGTGRAEGVIRSIGVVHDAENGVLGYNEARFDASDGNQDGDLPIQLPEGTEAAAVQYLLIDDATLQPLTGAWNLAPVTSEGQFTHEPLREVLPASDPHFDASFDSTTQVVTLTGAGFSPRSVIVIEGTVRGSDGLDHIAVVTVDARGVLSYSYPSSATTLKDVRVRIGGQGFDDILSFRVAVPVASVSVSGTGVVDGVADLLVGEVLALNAAVLPKDASDAGITWSSSEPGVASVDAAGAVTAHGVGTAVVTATANDGSGASAAVTIRVAPMVTPTPTPTPTATPKPTVTPTRTPTPKPTASATPKPTVTQKPAVAPYEVPGFHLINGRSWYTTCETYSQTIRCRTDIWATQVSVVKGNYVSRTGWYFNNLTYLPHMTRIQWAGNPLGRTGNWSTTEGRKWRTECDTAATGTNGCRSYIWATYVAGTKGADGVWRYGMTQGWLFNNIVRFK